MVAKATKQNQASATQAKTATKDTGKKLTKIQKHPSRKQLANGKKTIQTKVQAISASHIAEFETDSESEQESDQEQLEIDILLNMEKENE